MSAPASSTAIEPTLPSATDDSSDTVTDSTTAADGEDPSCVFFKPRSRSSNSNKGRKRGRSDIETDTTDDTTIVRPEKQQKKSLTSYSVCVRGSRVSSHTRACSLTRWYAHTHAHS